MFKKNDNKLETARRWLFILHMVCIACILGMVIIYYFFKLKQVFLGFLMLALGIFFVWISWILWDLLFSFLCDVKSIRNKLYGINNTENDTFFDR